MSFLRWALTLALAGCSIRSATFASELADSSVDSAGGINPSRCTQTIQGKQLLFAAELATASAADPSMMIDTVGDQASDAFGGNYRDNLEVHPGCEPRTAYMANTSEPFVTDNEATVPAGTPAVIDGYACAAKAYAQPAEVVAKPIVILVHGNSSGVTLWEEYFKAANGGTVSRKLASKLVTEGYRVYAFDARTDKVQTLTGFSSANNPASNQDHGWGVPMLQAFIKSVMRANPDREVSIVGHALGASMTRDALRRLYREHAVGVGGSVNPFPQLRDVVLLSPVNHGVNSGTPCVGGTANMRTTVVCELGDRAAYVPTYFTRVNNGPGDLWATPCADGDYAFGDHAACEGHAVQYTTISIADNGDGTFADEFSSEASGALDMPGCVDNQRITTDDYDRSGYFLNGIFKNHLGTARSDAGMILVLNQLAD